MLLNPKLFREFFKHYGPGIVAVTLVAFILYAQYGDSQLDRIYAADKIRFVLRDNPSHYYAGGDDSDIDGIELKLAELYAEHLNVKLKVVVEPTHVELFEALNDNEADIASAGLTKDVERVPPIRYSDTYQIITEYVVYLKGNNRPRTVEDLSKGKTVVSNETSYHKTLEALKEENPDLTYELSDELDTFEIMDQIVKGKVDYTVVDSHELEQFRRFYPDLSIAFEFQQEQVLAWGFKPMTYYTGLYNVLEEVQTWGILPDTIENIQQSLPLDNSLVDSANEFLKQITESGELEYWLDVYYGHILDFDYLDTSAFLTRMESRLPAYKNIFKKAASDDLDWILLAAIGYQESHWNPNAVSPTGVRGLMMLTMNTAKTVGVSNRLDPSQSIYGGARYFRRMHDLLPDDIPEPDRTWMALASYNVGLGHVQDVRKWVEAAGLDPNQWKNVREFLPKKRQAAWYRKSRHGFARGNEAVTYVENIRRYYDLLKYSEQKGE